MNQIRLGLAFCLLLITASLAAQQDSIFRDDPVAAMLDSLARNKYISRIPKQPVQRNNKFKFAPDSVPKYDALVYEARLAKLNAQSPFDLVYNPQVQGYINLYVFRQRKQVERMLGLSQLYYPMFEEQLDKYKLPLELKHLAVIESALNPTATSRSGARGLWQFMYTTGKAYDLEVTSYVDERCDPYQSTQAACEYLQFLYGMFGDWQLVLAAYNAGPGTINKAIRRAGGGKKTYWEIRPFLPVETQGYVPAFIAANYVMNFHEEHNLYAIYGCRHGNGKTTSKFFPIHRRTRHPIR
jgi:membrane-bound lytic murein transglycosylase D